MQQRKLLNGKAGFLRRGFLFTQVRQSQFIKLKDEWKKITAPLDQAKEKPLRKARGIDSRCEFSNLNLISDALRIL